MNTLSEVAVVIIGRNYWGNVTLPFIHSIRTHEPDVPIEVIDVASDPPYPGNNRIELCSYARSMNIAALLFQDYDWLLICNNDSECTAPFVEQVENLPKLGLYGAKWQWRSKPDFYGFKIEYMNGFVTCLHKDTYNLIGPFDEQFEALGGCEDIDYSLRVLDAGLPIEMELPFVHLGLHHRKRRADYRETVDRNRMRLVDKLKLRPESHKL